MDITLKNLMNYGFFSESIPQDSFKLNEVYDYIKLHYSIVDEMETRLKETKIISTPCHIISSYKNDLERRLIYFPHIEKYILLAKNIEENKESILNKINSSDNSQSKKFKAIGENYSIPSDFKKNFYKRIEYSMGYKYLLSLDLSKCYENMYTHSITWALLGKEKAKFEYNKSSKDRSEEFQTADKLDEYVRGINNNETKGIPTGPITSRIISELILCEIDSKFSDEGYSFKRYVDDYKFYFLSKEQAEQFVPYFQRVLNEYKLNINHFKTDLSKYPYEIQDTLGYELSQEVINKIGIVSYINKMNTLYLEGHRGALKYGLKTIKNKKIKESEEPLVKSQLINTLLVYPQISNLVIDFFKKNDFELDEKIGQILNKALENSLKLEHDVEIIWIIYFMKSFNLEISIENIIHILKRVEVFSTIYILDYITHKELYRVDDIKEQIKKLKDKLKEESIYGEKWLLIYEANRNNWIKGIKVNLGKKGFLKDLFDRDIKIYTSLFN